MKINISIDEELLAKIDAAAKEKYISRSGFIALAASEYINQQMVLKHFPEILEASKLVAEK